jgi:hypothetical protein
VSMTTYQMIEAIEETNRTWQPLSLPVRNKIAQRLNELDRENERLRAIIASVRFYGYQVADVRAEIDISVSIANAGLLPTPKLHENAV